MYITISFFFFLVKIGKHQTWYQQDNDVHVYTTISPQHDFPQLFSAVLHGNFYFPPGIYSVKWFPLNCFIRYILYGNSLSSHNRCVSVGFVSSWLAHSEHTSIVLVNTSYTPRDAHNRLLAQYCSFFPTLLYNSGYHYINYRIGTSTILISQLTTLCNCLPSLLFSLWCLGFLNCLIFSSSFSHISCIIFSKASSLLLLARDKHHKSSDSF